MNANLKYIIGLLILGLSLDVSAETLTIEDDLDVQGVLKVGDYATDPGTNVSVGVIRFGDDGNGANDFLGYVDGAWKSLTAVGGDNDQTLSISGDQLTISGEGGNTVTLPAGLNGIDGLSAYEIWLGVGNVGNEADFLSSLVGADGADGIDGAIGPQGPAGASPFVLNGNDVHYTSGNVGIGVTTPGEALDVSGNIRVDGAVILTNHAGDIPPINY